MNPNPTKEQLFHDVQRHFRSQVTVLFLQAVTCKVHLFEIGIKVCVAKSSFFLLFLHFSIVEAIG